MGIPDHLSCLLRNLYADREATVRTRHGTDWFQMGKAYLKAVYCHSAYLTSMQSTSCEMPGWMKHKLESRLPGEISITSDVQMTPPLWQKTGSRGNFHLCVSPLQTFHSLMQDARVLQRWVVPGPRAARQWGNLSRLASVKWFLSRSGMAKAWSIGKKWHSNIKVLWRSPWTL